MKERNEMKRLLAVLLVAVMAVSLCACGRDEVAKKTATEAFAGTWSVVTCNRNFCDRLGDFRLLLSHRAIFAECPGHDKVANPITDITECNDALAGEWELDGNRIYIFYEALYGQGADEDSVYILQIVDENTLTCGGHTYKRSQ